MWNASSFPETFRSSLYRGTEYKEADRGGKETQHPKINAVKGQNMKSSSRRKRMQAMPYEEMEKVFLLWFKHVHSRNFPASGPILEARDVLFSWLSAKAYSNMTPCSRQEAAPVNKDQLETGLSSTDSASSQATEYFQCPPNKALTYKSETGGKWNKGRITVFVGANMNCSEKLKLVAMGKARHSQCFQAIPVTYHSNSKAWVHGNTGQ